MKLFRALCAASLLPLLVLSACNKDKDPVAPYTGPEKDAYFPLRVGHYVEYNVDSTYWDDFLDLRTTKSMQQRYTIVDTFTDGQGRLSYRVDVSTRRYDTLSWQPESVFYVTSTPGQLEWVQGNLRFVKLRYPVVAGTQWDGNEFIATDAADLAYFANWPYKYTDVGSSFTNPGMTFDKTATVLQVDEKQNNPEQLPSAYAFRNYGKEVYAYGIGLVYKELVHWVYDPGVRKARKGYGVVMKAYRSN